MRPPPPPPPGHPPPTWPDGIPRRPGPPPTSPRRPIHHTANRRHIALPLGVPPPLPPPPHLAQEHDRAFLAFLSGVKPKVKEKSEPPKGVLGWMVRSSGKKIKAKTDRKDFIVHSFSGGDIKNSRPSSSIEQEEKRRRQAFLQQDPLNIHQTILKTLQGSARAPVTSVYDLANIIRNSCVDAFDQYKIPPDFQFFDFFERSIGAVVCKNIEES